LSLLILFLVKTFVLDSNASSQMQAGSNFKLLFPGCLRSASRFNLEPPLSRVPDCDLHIKVQVEKGHAGEMANY